MLPRRGAARQAAERLLANTMRKAKAASTPKTSPKKSVTTPKKCDVKEDAKKETHPVAATNGVDVRGTGFLFVL